MGTPKNDTPWPQLVHDALSGQGRAARELIEAITPVLHARVARALLRSHAGRRQGRDFRQDINDQVQDCFTVLLAENARALRAWDPARGLSFPNFVGLLAEHHVATTLRSGRKSPWKEEAMEGGAMEISLGASDGPHDPVASREILAKLLARLREELSPLGLELFQLLVVEERAVDEVCTILEMSADAVYAWRSRIGKLARKLRDEMQ